MTSYSVGFMHDDYNVVLIEKNRPEWQAGLLNGVGGKIELGEAPWETMVREFKEETGVATPPHLWERFLVLQGENAIVHCYAFYDNGLGYMDAVKTTTDEKVGVYAMNVFNAFDTVPNLQWIIPLMRQREKYHPIVVKFHGDS